MGGAHGMTEDEALMYTMRMMFAALEVRQVGNQSPKYQLCFYPLPFSQKLTRPLRLYSTIFRFEIKGVASRHFHCERQNTIEQPKGLTPIIRWNSNRMRAMQGSEVSVPRSNQININFNDCLVMQTQMRTPGNSCTQRWKQVAQYPEVQGA